MQRKQKFIANTFLLTAVTLLLRAVGIFFHVYIANKIGSAGVGLFSLVMSVYNFGVTFACSGIQLAATRIVSEELAIHSYGGARRGANRACIYALFFGSSAFLFIFFGASFFGEFLLGDTRCVLPLKILSVSLPCVAISSALSGYFTAVGRIYKSAVTQLAEQFIRIGGCVFFLKIFNANNAQEACIAVVLSGCIAEIFSFLCVFIFYRMDVRRYTLSAKGHNLTGRMLQIALPVAVSSYLRSGLSTIEHILIPRGFKKYGGNRDQALSSYGIVHGMAMPLIFFPSAVLNAFSTLLIPEIAGYYRVGCREKINAFIEKALYVTLAFSIGVSGIFYFFAGEIGMAIYQNPDVAYLLRKLAPLTAIMYFDGVVDAILKGLNQQVYSMGYNIIDSAVSIFLLLVLLPVYGMEGYIFILYITEMLNTFLSINRLLHVSDFKIYPIRWTLLPTLCIAVIGCFVKSMGVSFDSKVDALFGCLFTGCLYMVFLFLFSGKERIKTLVAKRRFL